MTLTETVAAMCTTTISTLTMACMLRDPLIRMVMHSDGVSDDDMSELLSRVKDTLTARGATDRQPAMVAG